MTFVKATFICDRLYSPQGAGKMCVRALVSENVAALVSESTPNMTIHGHLCILWSGHARAETHVQNARPSRAKHESRDCAILDHLVARSFIT